VPFIGNQNAKFHLNLPTQTTVAAAFVRSPHNVKYEVLSNCMNSLFNPNSVYGLLGNSAINFLTPHLFYCLNSLIKTQSFANTILLLFTLIASTNITYE